MKTNDMADEHEFYVLWLELYFSPTYNLERPQ